MAAKLVIQNYHPTTLMLDGAKVVIHVARMAMGEFLAFERKYFEVARPSGAEQANGIAEQMAGAPALDPAKVAKEDSVISFVTAAVEKYLTLPEGEIAMGDGSPMTTGTQFAAMFGARADLLTEVVNKVWIENKFPAVIKNALSSLSDLRASSAEPAKEAAGPKSEPTAEPAAPSDSASSEGVTTELKLVPKSSGETTQD